MEKEHRTNHVTKCSSGSSCNNILLPEMPKFQNYTSFKCRKEIWAKDLCKKLNNSLTGFIKHRQTTCHSYWITYCLIVYMGIYIEYALALKLENSSYMEGVRNCRWRAWKCRLSFPSSNELSTVHLLFRKPYYNLYAQYICSRSSRVIWCLWNLAVASMQKRK